ncbi:hypothetical protein [Polyangium sp. 6x1]|uniref:hypothetical protein n=1 Tax=Polyangium sp. 6x1 TaxID=3042689 RepID=UPI002482E0D6|nr:hypothetical protein [Polyangium sp. 6x1]MDI1445008.1 hypothetical protein [Polyangium sp. 6x1]
MSPRIMTFIPAEPEVPEAQHASGPLVLRYEDISQNGKLLLDAMPVVLGPSVWRKVWQQGATAALAAEGILPILSRFVIEGGDGPLSVMSPMEGEGRFQLAHTAGENGAVERLVLNMWCNVFGKAGRTHGPAPANAGERLLAGRVFAEHVITRPFGPPEARKVTRLSMPGLPEVPPDRYAWRPPEASIDLPQGARWLDDAFVLDGMHVVFGLDHTDSNQHVNSLVYPRLFLEAALRRLWDHGRKNPQIARTIEIAYRKPSFAGERTRVALRAFARDDAAGVAAILVSDEEAAGPIEKARPRVFARMWFADS